MDTENHATPLCGHTYSTAGGQSFRCVIRPHPRHPDKHYFVPDTEEERQRNAAAAQDRRRRQNRLVVIPGERRG